MKEIISKREQCRNAIKSKDWKKAFRLAKGFDAVFSKDDIQNISISYECLSGKENFYKSLKYNTDKIINDSKNILFLYLEEFDNKKIIYRENKSI